MTGIEEAAQRSAYVLIQEVRLYWLVALLYGSGALLFAMHFLTRSKKAGQSGRALIWTGVVLHVFLMALRTVECGRAPFQTLYESLSLFAFTACITYLAASRTKPGVYLPGLIVSAISAGACMYALIGKSPAADPLSPALQSPWFVWHVALAFLSYAVFVVSFAIETACIAARPLIRRNGSAFGMSRAEADDFRTLARSLVIFGFPLLTFAIFSGAGWANEAWGRYWSWDPKETWSLITWTVFALYLHAMAVPRLSGAPASILNILGFLCMMMTFLGVNWLAKLLGIPSLHAYAM